MTTNKYRQCSVEACEGNAHSSAAGGLGFCRKHYMRFRRHGSPLTILQTSDEEGLGFLKNVVANPPKDKCVIWPFAKIASGYGKTFYKGRQIYAHRLALILYTGENRPDLFACHAPEICHNPSCINAGAGHLFWATAKENASHRIIDGTTCLGEKNVNSKFTEQDVRQIRKMLAEGRTLAYIAKRFGVSISGISHIKHRRVWKHLD